MVAQLAPEERGHRRRDPDSTDQQAREPDQAEIGRQLREELAQPRLRFVERRDAHRRIADRPGEVIRGGASASRWPAGA